MRSRCQTSAVGRRLCYKEDHEYKHQGVPGMLSSFAHATDHVEIIAYID
jgi:hypothetical protein